MQSKDKRNQMGALEVKQFIADDNMRKTSMGKKGFGAGSQDMRGGASYLASSVPKGVGNNKFNLNDTMPVSGSNFNLIKQADGPAQPA